MDRLKELFPANRVAAIITFLTTMGTAVAALAGAWPEGSNINEGLVAVVGIVGGVATVLKFLHGTQKWEEYIANPRKDVNADGKPGNIWDPGDDPFTPPTDDEAMGEDDVPEPEARVEPDTPKD